MPPELDEPVCVGCRTRLRPIPSPACRRCGFPLGTRRPVAGRTAEPTNDAPTCAECESWPEAVLWARSAVSLEGVAADLVHGLKYEGWSGLAPYMGGRIERVLRPLVSRLGGPPVVVPVPTTRRRRRSRGYNQAELLASSVADRMNARFWAGIDRPGEGETQVVLHPDERLTNVRNAFVVAPSRAHEISGAHVVLIDDVLTTGATVSAVASTLIEAGADTVRVATFARALPR